MSDYKETIRVNESQGKEHYIPCVECLNETRHKVLQSVRVQGEASHREFELIDVYEIVQCQGCNSISFRKQHSDSEDYNEEEGYVETVEVFPSRLAGRHKLREAHFLPQKIRKIYDETHTALCSKQPILAGIGIRALVETVCKEKNAKGGDLYNKIDNLVDKGVLTRDGSEMLHSMRILGNDAAHDVKPHSEGTLKLAMDVVEHLLTAVYILPATTSNLPRRGTAGTS